MWNLWRNFSLRSRLTALSVGLLAALLSALGGGLYWSLRRFLLSSTALRVRAQAKPVIDRQMAAVTNATSLDHLAADLSRALTSRDTNALVFDQGGRPLADGRHLPEEPVAAPPRPKEIAWALAGDKGITYTTSRRGPRSLVALVPLRRTPTATDILGVVQLTTPLMQVDQILARQRRIIGLGILLSLGLGVVGELWLTSAALAPLRRMIATIHRIAAGDLGQRMRLLHARDEVGQLAAAFDEMASKIETAFASQSRFVSAAAHELRTPLTALQGSLEVLQRGSQDDPAAARRLMQGMHREITRLSRLAEQLLSLTRLDAPETLRWQRINIPAFVDDFARQARLLAGERQLRIVRGPATHLEADPDLLTQVLFNLTDNAVQHTESEGALEIGWDQVANEVWLWVADDGEGISPDDLPRIFEAFYRSDRARSRRRGGAGLGLAIVDAVVKAHGGRIDVVSQPAHGTRFTLRFPAYRRASVETGSAGAQRAEVSRSA